MTSERTRVCEQCGTNQQNPVPGIRVSVNDFTSRGGVGLEKSKTRSRNGFTTQEPCTIVGHFLEPCYSLLYKVLRRSLPLLSYPHRFACFIPCQAEALPSWQLLLQHRR